MKYCIGVVVVWKESPLIIRYSMLCDAVVSQFAGVILSIMACMTSAVMFVVPSSVGNS